VATLSDAPSGQIGSAGAATPAIAVIVAARNEEKHIGACLTSLMTQDPVVQADGTPLPVHIVVVDGRSEDDTREIVAATASEHGWAMAHEHPEAEGSNAPRLAERVVHLIDNPDRTTPHAFNRGIDATDASHLVIFSAHSHAQPNYLQENLRAMEATQADIVGGSLHILGDGPTASAIALAQTSKVGTGGASYRQEGSSGWADTVPFPFFHRSLLDRIGRFDEELLRNQDDEFIHRARQDGARVWLDADINSTYISRSSLSRLFRQYHDYGRYRMVTIAKRGEAGSVRQLAPLLAAVGGATVTAASAAARRPRIPLAFAAMYGVVVAAEGLRLTRRPGAAATTAAAIATQHGAYALGQLRGLRELRRAR